MIHGRRSEIKESLQKILYPERSRIMFSQFFGNYLLNKGLVSPEWLDDALSKQKDTRLKRGVLAVDAGIMTAAQVDMVHA